MKEKGLKQGSEINIEAACQQKPLALQSYPREKDNSPCSSSSCSSVCDTDCHNYPAPGTQRLWARPAIQPPYLTETILKHIDRVLQRRGGMFADRHCLLLLPPFILFPGSSGQFRARLQQESMRTSSDKGSHVSGKQGASQKAQIITEISPLSHTAPSHTSCISVVKMISFVNYSCNY